MFNIFDVQPDPNKLKGVLFLVAEHRIEIPQSNAKLPKNVFEHKHRIIQTDIQRYWIASSELQNRFKRDIDTVSLSDVLSDCEEFFDGYDAGLVKDDEDWKGKIKEARICYGLEYNLQKHDRGLEIDGIAICELRQEILTGLCQNLAMSVEAKNHFAQMRAEKVLDKFLSAPKYKKPLEEIIGVAATVPYSPMLMENRMQLVLSMADENYPSVIHLQREYAQITGKV